MFYIFILHELHESAAEVSPFIVGLIKEPNGRRILSVASSPLGDYQPMKRISLVADGISLFRGTALRSSQFTPQCRSSLQWISPAITQRSITSIPNPRNACILRQVQLGCTTLSPSQNCPRIIPRSLAIRNYADQPADTSRPRPPELDLKQQSSEEMQELQKEQEIKDKQKQAGQKPAKQDILEESNMSKAEQRKVNWGILKTLVKYIWPKVCRLCGYAN